MQACLAGLLRLCRREPWQGSITPATKDRGRRPESRIGECVLLLGEKRARTPIRWSVLEGVGTTLAGGGWMTIGSVYDTRAVSGTLDAYLKRFINRATAGWVAALLEKAGVVQIDRGRPSRVRLR